MAQMTEKIIALDREARRKIDEAEKKAVAILSETEERSGALLQEAQRRLGAEREALFSEIHEKLEKYEAATREDLKKEIEKLSERFDRDAVVEEIYRRIEKRLCRKER